MFRRHHGGGELERVRGAERVNPEEAMGRGAYGVGGKHLEP